MNKLKFLLVPLFLALFSTSAFAGRIVAFHDEWVFSSTGFTQAGGTNAATFAQNVAGYLSGTPGSGNILIYSDSATLAGAELASALTSAGYGVSFLLSTNPLPADLSVYSGIFLGGLPGNATGATLTNYVNNGGGVFVQAGYGFMPNLEADKWNPFLNNFGLGFATTYNGLQGNFPINGTHQILNGVSQLYYDNGNDVMLTGGSPLASLVQFGPNQNGLIGVYDSAAVPEPMTLALLGMGVFGAARRRKLSV